MEGDDIDSIEGDFVLDNETLGFEVDTFASHVDVQRRMAHDSPDVLELFDNFMADTQKHVNDIREQAISYEGDDEAVEIQFTEDMKYYNMESNTWDLVALMLRLRMNRQDEAQVNKSSQKRIGRYESNEVLKNRLMDEDQKFKELIVILEWLKHIAPEPVLPEDEEGDSEVRESGWMYTLQTLKQYKRLHQRNASQVQVGQQGTYEYPDILPSATDPDISVVTELDPDAPTRLHRSIEPDDRIYDVMFGKILYGYIRRGDYERAARWCEECGQWWRVPAVLGGTEGRDGLIDESLSISEADKEAGPKGNRRRALWRRMCFANARKDGTGQGDTFEKAAYGVLSGDLDSVCRSIVVSSNESS